MASENARAVFVIFLSLVVLDGVVRGQASGSQSPDAPYNVVPGLQVKHSATEIAFSISVLVFGAILVGLQVLVLVKRSAEWNDWSFKLMGISLVITAGLFLIVAGYTERQTAPMMALLGTVAGYIL